MAQFVGPGVSRFMTLFGEMVKTATEMQPFFMGILVSALIGIALTLPISLSLIHILAEYIGGDEGTFVRMMNERAAGLGMERTKFVDCCGLTDSPDHVTTARDIALMSRELITKYPQIINYSTIWMENITHVTSQGTKEFGLSNTCLLYTSRCV